MPQVLKRIGGAVLLTIALIVAVPCLLAARAACRLWGLIAPIPFCAADVVRSITPIVGDIGARNYVSGLRRGFHNGLPRPHCGHPTLRPHVIERATLLYNAGRRDGTKLRHRPNSLSTILKCRCRDRSQSISSAPRTRLPEVIVKLRKRRRRQENTQSFRVV